MMKVQEAVEHFGSVQKLAEVLKITHQAIYHWGDYVPEGRAYQLEVLTGGALRAPRPGDPETDSTEGGAAA